MVGDLRPPRRVVLLRGVCPVAPFAELLVEALPEPVDGAERAVGDEPVPRPPRHLVAVVNASAVRGDLDLVAAV